MKRFKLVAVAGILLAGATAAATLNRTSLSPGHVESEYEQLQATIARSRSDRAEGKPGYGKSMRWAAARLFNTEHADEALEVLTEIADQPETSFDQFEALRMKGQYFSILGRDTAAREQFAAALALADAQPMLKYKSPSYGSAAQQYGNLLSMARMDDAALAAYSRITGDHDLPLDPRLVADTFCNTITACQRAGWNEQMGIVIDHLFDRFPTYGQDDGSVFSLKLLRADLADPEGRSPAYVETLRALWNSRSDHEQAADVGLALSQSLRARSEFGQALQHETELLAFTERLLSLGAGRGQSVGDIRRTVLHQMASADEQGRPDLAATAIQALRDSAQTLSERQGYEDQMTRLPPDVRR